MATTPAGPFGRSLLTRALYLPPALLISLAGLGGSSIQAGAVTCSAAGSTGLTAAVVAAPGETITGSVNASGCDVGIYVPPGADGVTISGATVSGARDQGVLAQDVSDFTLVDSMIMGNGTTPNAAITDNKAVTLVGTTRAVVRANEIHGNAGGGGLALVDDGALNPGALAGHAGSARPSLDNLVADNDVFGNLRGCGIVLAAWNPGQGVIGNLVTGNRVSGAPGSPPAIGSIVVAADAPFTEAHDNTIGGNVVTTSAIPGIIVHANAPGDLVSNTVIRGNTLSGNDFTMGDGPAATVGIAIRANTFASGTPPAVIDRTLVTANRITDQDYGIWISGATNTHVGGFGLNEASVPLYPPPANCERETSSANC